MNSEPPQPKRSKWQRFRCAVGGILYVLRTQANSPIHIFAIAAVIAVGLWLDINRTEWAIITIATSLVVITETINTAIERAVDLAQPNEHPLAKISKDVAAGAVLLSVIAAVIVGLLIFLPPLLEKARDMK